MQKQSSSQKKPSRRKYIIPAVIILCILVGYIYLVVTWTPADSESKKASDAVIRQIAAVQLNKDPNDLTDEDFAQIREFTLTLRAHIAAKLLNKEPNDLTNEDTYQILDYITKNMKLNYSGVVSVIYLELSDIRLLKKLQNLQTLSIRSVRLPEKDIPAWMQIFAKLGIYNPSERFYIDLSPLKNLSGLNTLSLEGSYIKNIKPLSKLINLKELNLNNTSVFDLKPLKELQNLKILSIKGCENIKDEQVDELQKALPNLKINRGK